MSLLACENIRFSSLFVAEDVARGGRNVLSDEERGETDVFAGYVTVSEDIFNLLVVRARRLIRLQSRPHGASPKSDQRQQKRL